MLTNFTDCVIVYSNYPINLLQFPQHREHIVKIIRAIKPGQNVHFQLKSKYNLYGIFGQNFILLVSNYLHGVLSFLYFKKTHVSPTPACRQTV